MATEIVQTETAAQIADIQAQANAIATAPVSPLSSNTFLFYAGFDGTNNIKDNPGFSGDQQSTAIGEITDQIIPSENVAIGYYPGVGTPGTLPGSSIFPTQQAIATAQEAYNDFSISAANWLVDHPGGSISVAEASFSRGSVPAAIFSQMLWENGLVTQADIVKPDGTIIPAGTTLISPGEVGVSANLVISPVGTGASGNLDFAPNVQNSVVVLADNEYRSLYAQSIYSDPGVTTVVMNGNHGDIGAIYDTGIGGIALDAYHQYLSNAGLDIAPVLPSRAFDPNDPVVIHAEVFDWPHATDTVQNIWTNGSIGDNAPISDRTTPVGQSGWGYCTNTGDVTTFVDYKGDTVTINSIAGVTQDVTITPFGATTGTTIDYSNQPNQPILDTIVNADGSTTVNAIDSLGELLQSTTTLASGEITQTNYTDGEATSVMQRLPDGVDGSITVNNYDGTGSILESRLVLQQDGETLETFYENGNATSVIQTAYDGVSGTTTVNQYDGSGSTLISSTVTSLDGTTIETEYIAQGQISSQIQSSEENNTTTVTNFDSNGLVDEINSYSTNLTNGNQFIDEANYNSAGGLQSEGTFSIAPNGEAFVNVTGQGFEADIENAMVNLAADAAATFFGDSNAFLFDDNASGTVFGDFNTILGNEGSDFGIFGDNNIANNV